MTTHVHAESTSATYVDTAVRGSDGVIGKCPQHTAGGDVGE